MKVTKIDTRLMVVPETEFEEEYLKDSFQGEKINVFLKCGATPSDIIGLVIDVNVTFMGDVPKVKVIDIIEELEGVALNAVDYVGAANYQDREEEAKSNVRNKAKELIDALDNEHN